jgi:hypothetical protein
MILSIEDKRLRNYLLPYLGDRNVPAPSAASEATPAVVPPPAPAPAPAAAPAPAPPVIIDPPVAPSLAQQAALAAAEAWYLAGAHVVLTLE